MFLLQSLLPRIFFGVDSLQLTGGFFACVSVKNTGQLLELTGANAFNRDAHQTINEQPAMGAFDTEPDNVEVGFRGVRRAMLQLRQLRLGGKGISCELEFGEFGQMRRTVTLRICDRHLDWFA